MRFSIILILLLCLFTQAGNIAAQSAVSKKFQGFLGTYHPFKGTTYGGSGWTEGEPLQNAFAFGENAVISQSAYNGYTFAENIENNCREWNVNKVYGILRPPTEKGVINQPNDSVLLKPFSSEPGMIQGARRFSELSKRCPQISGVIIDDFYNDYPKLLSDEDLRNIKDALVGKRLDGKGRIDRSSPATTPNLKLYIVVYEHQLNKSIDQTVLDAVDGISFWVWKQNESYARFDDYIATIRKNYAGKEILAGVYVYSGKVMMPASVHHLIERAVEHYEKGNVNGLLIFSAIWMSREKITRERWDELALPQVLNRAYYPFLGEGRGRVVDTKTREPIKGALVTIRRRAAGGKSLLVARKFTDDKGEYGFGGWAGRAKGKRAAYEIRVENGSSEPREMRVQLRAGKSLQLADVNLRQ